MVAIGIVCNVCPNLLDKSIIICEVLSLVSSRHNHVMGIPRLIGGDEHMLVQLQLFIGWEPCGKLDGGTVGTEWESIHLC